MLARGRLRLFVTGVEVPDDAHARIRREHALEPLGRRLGAVGDDDHAGVDRVADADATAVMDADPRRSGCDVDERIQDRPVGDRVRAVEHRLGLAVRRRDGARVEMITPDHHRRLDRTGPDELVDREPGARPVAETEPADAGREPLERDPFRCQLEPALEQLVVGEELAQRLVDRSDVGRVARTARPSETARSPGRRAAGYRPGRSPGTRTHPSHLLRAPHLAGCCHSRKHGCRLGGTRASPRRVPRSRRGRGGGTRPGRTSGATAASSTDKPCGT